MQRAAWLLHLLLGQRLDELVPMLHALLDRPIAAVVAVELHEAGDLAHIRLLQCRRVLKPLTLRAAVDRYTFAIMYIQEIVMQVAKWGNSLAVRLPAKLVAELGLAEGDEIEVVRATPERLEIEKKIERQAAIDVPACPPSPSRPPAGTDRVYSPRTCCRLPIAQRSLPTQLSRLAARNADLDHLEAGLVRRPGAWPSRPARGDTRPA